MTTPTELIAALDDALTKAGENITMHVMTAGVPDAGATCRAAVRGYQPHEIVGSIAQQDRKVIASPTTLTFVPKRGDRAVIASKAYSVEAAIGIRVQGTIVRIEMQVRG